MLTRGAECTFSLQTRFVAFRVSWRLVDDGAAAPPSPATKALWWRFVDAAGARGQCSLLVRKWWLPWFVLVHGGVDGATMREGRRCTVVVNLKVASRLVQW